MPPLIGKQIVVAVVVGTVFFVGIIAFFLREEPEVFIAEQAEIEEEKSGPIREVIGTSVEGREIEAYTYLSVQAGEDGEKHVLFVGGVHGGYEWNSVLLAYQFMDHLNENPDIVPNNVTVSVIPSANPDGVYDVVQKEGRFVRADVPADEGPVGTGRFNARDVDLNRNFDCKWKPESTWRGNTVDAGSEPFSEPEAIAIRDFVLENNPDAVIFWHSQSNAVYASECEGGILSATLAIMNAYSNASGYQPIESFDAYDITGDAEGWLASIGIPAITVELRTHDVIEWEKNLAGIKALFALYSE